MPGTESALPQTPHIEKHFTANDRVRDIVIGMSDGLTVPFALAAGLTGAIASTGVIVTAGLAEIAAGSIAMGLGGYLAARSDAEHYDRERQREYSEVRDRPEIEAAEVTEVFQAYGLSPDESAPVVEALVRKPDAWIDFMMRFELGLEKPNPKRALASALTIAFAYVVGGLIPLTPYIVLRGASRAFSLSVIATLAALWIFGYGKGKFIGIAPAKSALQTTFIGGTAAAAAFLIARAVS